MKKIIQTILILTGIILSQTVSAQNAVFKEGDRTISIIANPVFGYLGNMFNQDTYNSLNLSSGGFVFRKFKSPTRAIRFSFDVSLANRTNAYLTSGFSQTTNSYYLGFDIGKEYRKSFTNLSVYGGWTIGVSTSGNVFEHDYYEPAENSGYRTIVDNHGNTVGIYGGAFVGTEYYFSEHFYIGAELRLTANFGYRFNESETTEYYSYSGNTLVKTIKTTEANNSTYAWMQSNNAVLFTVGIKF